MASTHAREGGRFLQAGQPQEAVKSFQKGLSIDPRDVDCLLGLVRTHLSTGATGEAEGAVLRLLEVRPDHVEAQGHLAMLRARAGDAEALESLKVLAAAPTAGYFERFNLGSLLFERGDLPGAKAAFESALTVMPGSAHTHFELGRIAMQTGDRAGAVEHFQKASELAPQEAMPLLLLSRAHAARSEVGLAIQAATQALEKARGATQRAALEDLFKLYLAAGSPEGAKRSVQELRRLEPGSVSYVYLHGLAVMSAGEMAEAKALFEEVLRRAPGSWQARHALAQVCGALGEREQVRTLLEEAVAAAPDEPGPVNDLAVLLMQDDAHARARTLLERVAAAHPRDAGTHLNLALAAFPSDKAAAARHAKQAQALGDSAIQEQATRLLQQLGT